MIMVCSQCTKLHSKNIQLIFVMVEVHHKKMYTRLNITAGAVVRPFRSAAPVVVSVLHDDILDPSPSWLHPLLPVPRRWLDWSTLNQGLVAAPGFDPICRVSLTDQSCFFLVVGRLSYCRVIYSHGRDLQCHKMVSTPEGHSHVRSPK